MSFPMASRFSHYTPCSPAPTAYNIPHVFDEGASNRSGAWPKPFLFTGHSNCDENCTPNICKKDCKEARAGLFKRPISSRRYSLDPNAGRFTGEGTQNKAPGQFKANLSASSSENKENVFSPQRKINSHIPRFRKNLTEAQAPSFVLNPRDIHSCYNKEKKGVFPPTNCFNRYSIERKSIKPIKKNDKSTDSMDEDDSPEKDDHGSVLKKKRPFNKSYTVLPKLDENPQDAINTVADDINRNVDHSIPFSLSKLLKKDSALAKELSNTSGTSKYYEITNVADDGEHSQNITGKTPSCDKITSEDIGCKRDSQMWLMMEEQSQNVTGKMRSCDLSGLDDCDVVFLVSEEFIDDEYDSYMTGLNGAKSYMEVSQNKELYNDYGTFQTNQEKPKKAIKRKGKLAKTDVRTKIGKIFTRQKPNKNLWNDIESVIRQAIKELKGEFQMEIYKKTNEKLDRLISDLKSSILKANEDIEIKCERTTENLISRLQNMAMK